MSDNQIVSISEFPTDKLILFEKLENVCTLFFWYQGFFSKLENLGKIRGGIRCGERRHVAPSEKCTIWMEYYWSEAHGGHRHVTIISIGP